MYVCLVRAGSPDAGFALKPAALVITAECGAIHTAGTCASPDISSSGRQFSPPRNHWNASFCNPQDDRDATTEIRTAHEPFENPNSHTPQPFSLQPYWKDIRDESQSNGKVTNGPVLITSWIWRWASGSTIIAGAPHATISTGVPSGISSKHSAISALLIRTHPWLAGVPSKAS